MPIAAKGRKDETLAAALREQKEPDADVGFYVGKRALKLGKETLEPGDEIPEARYWPRREAWLRSGSIVEGPPNEVEPVDGRAAPEEPAFRSGFPREDSDQAGRPAPAPKRGRVTATEQPGRAPRLPVSLGG